MRSTRRKLEEQHTPDAIELRLAAATQHSYLRDFVFGAMDGTVTTFAIVAGAAGANFPNLVALIMGLANLVADGFSMAVGNYISTKSDMELIERARRREEMHIEQIPEGEREEIRQIFAAKGFSGDVLDEVVRVITNDREQWVNTMLTEELGLRLEAPSPWRAGASTFVAFAVAGAVPLSPFILNVPHELTFAVSTIATLVTFFLIGMAKGYVVHRRLLTSGLETLFVGSIAAGMAYLIGTWLHGLVGG